VAALALGAAARHGFALGGGNALIAHGLIGRVTNDVGLFTDREDGVAAAAASAERARCTPQDSGPNARIRPAGCPTSSPDYLSIGGVSPPASF
jgi:hypothetical protein